MKLMGHEQESVWVLLSPQEEDEDGDQSLGGRISQADSGGTTGGGHR